MCKETRLKHEELNQQRKLRAEAVERTCQKERTLISTRRQYDEKLRKSDQEYKDVVNTLTSARIQVQGEEGRGEGKERKGVPNNNLLAIISYQLLRSLRRLC